MRTISFSFYYLVWLIFILLFFAFLFDDFYQIGSVFLPMVGFVTIPLTLIYLGYFLTQLIAKKDIRQLITRDIKLLLIPIIVSLTLLPIYFLPNPVDNQISKIHVSYLSWNCDCANWSLNRDNGKEITGSDMFKEYIYIEPIDKSSAIPETVDLNHKIFALTGRFHRRKSFPKNYSSEEHPDKARVFRYSSYNEISK